MAIHVIGGVWSRLIKFLFILGAGYICLIVAGTIWEVIARNFTPIEAPIWLTTFIEFGLPAATMLAAPQLVRERKHVSMEIIDTALNESQRRFLIMCTDLVAAAVAGFVAYYAVTTGLEEWNRGNVLRLAIDVPRWIFFAVLASGFTLCVVEFLRHAYLAIAKGDIEPDQKESLPT